jgi:hypothetical protein
VRATIVAQSGALRYRSARPALELAHRLNRALLSKKAEDLLAGACTRKPSTRNSCRRNAAERLQSLSGIHFMDRR